MFETDFCQTGLGISIQLYCFLMFGWSMGDHFMVLVMGNKPSHGYMFEYNKKSKNLDTRKIAVIFLKLEQLRFTIK